MKRRQAFKFELMPTGQQQRDMRRFAGVCRFVFNQALDAQSKNHEAGNKFVPYVKMTAWLVQWKQDAQLAWLKEAPSQSLQHAMKDLERAYKNFFAKRAAFPRFKKRGKSDSFRYPQGMKLEQENSRLFLPKLGWICYRTSRPVIGTVKNVTVSCHGGKWTAAIQTEVEISKPQHPSTSIVGIDVGIAKFATLSDGTIFKPVNSYKQRQPRLSRLQRQLSRKKKFSNNWKKAKANVQKLHRKIANIRRDYLHQTSTEISKNHAMIVIEDLRVSNMSSSAKGSVENPGRQVKAKSGLNRAILDQGWFEFRRQLGNTSNNGEAVKCWRFPPRTRAENALTLNAGISPKKIDSHSQRSNALRAATPSMQMSTHHVTY